MMKKNSTSFLKKNLAAFIFLAVLIVLPNLFTKTYYTRVLMEVFYFASLGIAWNILGGYGQQTCWCAATFFACGSYTSMLMYLKLGEVSPFISVFCGMLVACALAFFIGLPCFRLNGVFFSIATIACATIFRNLLIIFKDFTGGTLGLAFKIRTEASLWKMSFQSDLPYYYIALGMLVIAIVVEILFVRSKWGYYLQAIRDDQTAAESLGIRSSKVKMIALLVAACLLSATGTVYAFKVGYIDPNVVASHDMSIRIGIMAILGGMGTIWGPVVGAFIAIPLQEVANNYLSRVGGGGAGYAMFGLLIVLIVLFRPAGVISLWEPLVQWCKRTFGKKGAKEVANDE